MCGLTDHVMIGYQVVLIGIGQDIRRPRGMQTLPRLTLATPSLIFSKLLLTESLLMISLPVPLLLTIAAMVRTVAGLTRVL